MIKYKLLKLHISQISRPNNCQALSKMDTTLEAQPKEEAKLNKNTQVYESGEFLLMYSKN